MIDLPDVGALVTIVFKDHVYQTAVVDGMSRRDQFVIRNWQADEVALSIHDEGVEWLRGCHALDSEAARAAQAAQALAAKAKPEPKPKPRVPTTYPTPQASLNPLPQDGPFGDEEDGERMRRDLWAKVERKRGPWR